MKKLIPWLAAAAFWLIPHPALAVTCSAGTPFGTGQLITANSLNSPLQGLANCTNQLDYRNIGSAGIFASQLNPQSSAQATFGGSYPYTFTQPLNLSQSPNLSQPLTKANGGTGSTDGSINGVGFVAGGQPTKPGLSTNGGPINLDPVGPTGIGLGYDNSQLSNVQFGPNGNWGNWTANGLYMQGNLTLPGNYNVSANQGTFKGVSSSGAGYSWVNTSPANSSSMFLNSNGDLQFYDLGGGHNYNVTIAHSNGYLKAPGLARFDGTYDYPVPYDATGVSNPPIADFSAHMEHGTVTAPASGTTTSCAPNQNFTQIYSTATRYPTVVVSIVGGSPYTAYIQTIVGTYFQACIISNNGTNITNNIQIQWISLGE